MSRNDLLMLAAGFLVVCIVVTLAILFPVYRVYEGVPADGSTFVRRAIWDPPTISIPSPYTDKSDEDLEQMAQKDPRVGGWIENWKKSPKEIAVRPIFVGSKGSNPDKDRNWLGTAAMFTVFLYGILVFWKWQNQG